MPNLIRNEGKTKIVILTDQDGVVRIVSKDDVTAFDDPTKTIVLEGKGAAATATTCNMFEALNAAGIPTAYIGRCEEPNAFLAYDVEMLPLECIGRRYVGKDSSYRKRHPELPAGEYYFARLWTEYSLKTTRGELKIGDNVIVTGLDPAAGEEDPLIKDVTADEWVLLAKKPEWAEGANLSDRVGTVKASDIIGDIKPSEIDRLLRRAVLAIEAFLASVGLEMEDIKLEFGLRRLSDGTIILVVADVVDGDSWRARDKVTGVQYSKQVFRDQSASGEHNYALLLALYQKVAELTTRIRIPKQALVLWRGSDSDKKIPVPGAPLAPEKTDPAPTDSLPGVAVIDDIAISGHKQTRRTLAKLEELMSQFPEGGVIIDKAGMSNGLGPITATHIHWPVISVPGSEDFPEDVWSSLRMPSDVPMATILRGPNAINFALRALALHNPALAGQIRYIIEEMDPAA
jgi:phosphoribosylaminoimidazole-succinocarboxamide synthase/phosphoribosylcarboxyaminoimidazole (NCAIR) mutase